MTKSKKMSRVLSKLLAMFLVLSLFAGLVPTTALAASPDVPDRDAVWTGWKDFACTGGHSMWMSKSGNVMSFLMSDSGMPLETAYCVDHGKNNGPVVPSSTELIAGKGEMLKKAIGYGFSYNRKEFLGKPVGSLDKSTGGNYETYYMATQILVWEICAGFRTDFNASASETAAGLNAIGKTQVAKAYEKLITAIRESLTDDPFAPKGFYKTQAEAEAKATMVDLTYNTSAGGQKSTHTYEVGPYLQDFTKMRVIYGPEQAVYDMLHTPPGSSSAVMFNKIDGEMSALYGISATGNHSLNLGFNVDNFKAGETLFVKAYRFATDSPVCDGTLTWYKNTTENIQRRIQFYPKPNAGEERWMALKTNKTPTEIVKVWLDNNNKDAIRPNSVTFKLYQCDYEMKPGTGGDITEYGVPNKPGTLIGTYTLGYESNGTTPLAGTLFSDDPTKNTWTFNLPVLTPGKYYYVVENEENSGGYTTTYNGLTVTNSLGGGGIPMDYPNPEWTFPSFDIRGEKDDKNSGFDGDVSTPRGNATLAAGFIINWNNGHTTGGDTVYAPHLGEYAHYGFSPWDSTADASSAPVIKTKGTCSGPVPNYYKYTYSLTVTVDEEVPEGFHSEPVSGTGTGHRSYTVTYTAEAKRTVADPHDQGDCQGIEVGEWEYTYTCVSSDTGTNVKQGTAHDDHNIAKPRYRNEVKKGDMQLVKTFDEDLDQWTIVGGVKKQMPNSWWTLETVESFTDGNDFSDGADYDGGNVDLGGSESHPYVMVQKVAQGEPGYSRYGNSYRVVDNPSGTSQHAAPVITADGGLGHPNPNNVLVTGGEPDQSGNMKGQLYVLGLPYGYYKMTEIRCNANEGYVLETYYFYVREENDLPSQEVNDEVIENEILVQKENFETGKTVPYAGAAFRIKYLGYYHSASDATFDQKEFRTNAHSGTYIKNGRNITDEYQYVFYTNAAGKIRLPYPLEYGVWQLEEIIAPPGYYIGDYSDGTGIGQNADGTKGFYDTCAIFGPDGKKINYTNDGKVLFNYYTFEVKDQQKGQIVVNLVHMKNNATKGKIELKKVGEKLVGFTESDSKYGKVTTPVYEMKPLPGAKFEVVSATDTVLFDGYDSPKLFKANGQQVTPEVVEFTHLLWPDAQTTSYASLPDGTDAYITTERFSENDGHPNNSSNSANNIVSAKLLSALQQGVEYKLKYDVSTTSAINGITVTTTYDITVGLEYAAGGWNYSYIDVTRKSVSDDYVSSLPNEMPVITQDGVEYKVNELDPGIITLPDGSSINILAKAEEYINEDGVSVNQVLPEFFRDEVPVDATRTVPAHNYLPDTELLTLTVPAGFDETTNVSVDGGYCFTDGAGNYVHAILNSSGSQEWLNSNTDGQETTIEDYYSNQPDVTTYLADGWTLSVKTINVTDGDFGSTYSDKIFVLNKDATEMWYVVNNSTGDGRWLEKENLKRTEMNLWRSCYSLPLPAGFDEDLINLDYGFFGYSLTEECYVMLARDAVTNELKWVRADGYRNTYLSRTVSARIDLNESKKSVDGFKFQWGDFVLTNAADHINGFATAKFVNPSDNTPSFFDGVGCETSTSDDGKELYVKVVQPDRKAYYELVDGVKAWITYLGGYTKTTIEVPHAQLFPTIKYKGATQDYWSKLTPLETKQTVDLGDGNYIETFYDQMSGRYLIDMVSNGKTDSDGFTVDYATGHRGYSTVVQDPSKNATRGCLYIDGLSRTLVYQSGAVVQTLTTNADGIAYSTELPLGTYYIREIDAGLGYVISTGSYRVDLTYANQYIPLVWGSATVKNEALNVTVDIAKSFQEAYGSDNYIYKAGAVFGVYNKGSIAATSTPSNPAAVTKSVAEPESLMNIITIGDDGFATASIKLPFKQDYYLEELDTLAGYTKSDVKYLFRADETAIADNLKFDFEHDGIIGQINQTDLFETTVKINTYYQVPAKHLTVNGMPIISDAATSGTAIAGAALVKNEVLLDKTITTVTATDAGPTVITFENGATLTINVFSDGYTAVFTDPTEGGCTLRTNKGNVATTTILEENTPEGLKFTYNPSVAYTGYTVDVTDSYRAPTTVMTTKDGVIVNITFDKASGHRLAVMTYPKHIPLPEATEAWITVDTTKRTVAFDMDTFLSESGGSKSASTEYKVILKYIEGHLEAKNFTYVVAGGTALTAADILAKSSARATLNGANRSITINDVELAAINNKISDMFAGLAPGQVSTMFVKLTANEATEHEMHITIQVELVAPGAESQSAGNTLVVRDDRQFPVYGEDVCIAVDRKSFEVETAGKASSYASGLRNDNINVSYTNNNEATVLSHTNKEILVRAESGTSSMKMTLSHDSSVANVNCVTGAVSNAYMGTTPVTFAQGYPVSPGETLTVMTSDGTLYKFSLDTNGVAIAHCEKVLQGNIATGTNAPSAFVDGTEYFTDKKLVTDAVIEFGTNITYNRSSNTVTSISVKINSKAENHMTTKQEDGEKTGRPDDIMNKVIYVEFEKADMQGRPLAGAVIAAYDSNGVEVFRGTTNSNGIARWTKVKPGEYTFREIQAPKGYVLDSTSYPITVYPDGTISGNRTLYNKLLEVTPDTPRTPTEKPENVVIHKTDLTDGKPVSGATITVWNKETGRQIFSGVTDSKGEITFPRPEAGTYVFREIVAPFGYILNTEQFEFRVHQNGTISGTLGITNEKKLTPETPKYIVISKTDATDASPVAGAEITIWNSYGQEVFKGITDKAGQIKFEVPAPGTYTFRETYAPEGYDINELTFTFTVNSDGTVKGKSGLKDIRTGTVVITKTDVIDGAEIPGATIRVEDSKGNVVFEQVTDEYGKIYFFPPAPGTYTFYETASPDGYYLNEEKFQFTVDADGKITAGVTHLENVPYGTVVIKKTDVSDGKELKDAEITIWDASGKEVFKGKTDERGRVYFVSPGPGTYTFRETIAPNGYLINEETFTFTIDENFMIHGATNVKDQKMTNIPKTGIDDWTNTLWAIFLFAILFMSMAVGFMPRKGRKSSELKESLE